MLPEEAKRLPAELVWADAYLDDERFIAPWRGLFSRGLGRPSVLVDTLPLLYLKHRYQLGYESLCREVQVWRATAAGRLPAGLVMGGLGQLAGELAETIGATGRLLAQTDQRLAGDG